MHGQALSFPPRQDVAATPPEARMIEALRALTRNGYAADPEAPADGHGLLLRHDSGPDLVLHADGRLELPSRPSPKPALGKLKTKSEKRISWRRTFLVFVVAMIAWAMSVFLGVALLSS